MFVMFPWTNLLHSDVLTILWKQLYLNVFIVVVRRKERLENTRLWTWCFEKENVTSMCQCCTKNNNVIKKYIEFDYGISEALHHSFIKAMVFITPFKLWSIQLFLVHTTILFGHKGLWFKNELNDIMARTHGLMVPCKMMLAPR
jgi:hypothetical protein